MTSDPESDADETSVLDEDTEETTVIATEKD